ncbi:hypothetical protein HYC85_019898 [Camellia sinensis]|uniref:Uncharacterized protein n=1 Tax=Camellia sinensis TaxID=4442 RepID=A0A7J7GRY7_CAMSI|nr:hypothetical protein HYC85_019898 [Camellia sinensis]
MFGYSCILIDVYLCIINCSNILSMGRTMQSYVTNILGSLDTLGSFMPVKK